MTAVLRNFDLRFERVGLFRAIRDHDHIAGLHDEGRDVDDAAVDREVPMVDQLTSLFAAHREVQAVHDIIEAAFERLEEDLTGLTRDALRFTEVALELRLEHAVVTAHLLLFTQLAAVFRNLLTRLGILRLLTRSGTTALDRALAREAAVAFEEQLDLFARF